MRAGGVENAVGKRKTFRVRLSESLLAFDGTGRHACGPQNIVAIVLRSDERHDLTCRAERIAVQRHAFEEGFLVIRDDTFASAI